MSDQFPARTSHPVDLNGALRVLAMIAVVGGVLVLAAAAFVLSYAGIHAIALTTGVSPALARLYPLIFDAMLVVAAAAILSLRGAGLLTRCYAWLSLLVLLCVAAWADALHATAAQLPHRAAAATVAIIPWALALLGFGLLLAMLRHMRLRQAQVAEERANAAPAPSAGAALTRPAPVPAAALAAGTQAALAEGLAGTEARDHGAGEAGAAKEAERRPRGDQAAALGDGHGPAVSASQEKLPAGESGGSSRPVTRPGAIVAKRAEHVGQPGPRGPACGRSGNRTRAGR